MKDDGIENVGARRSAWRIGLTWVKVAISIGLLWLLFAAYDIQASVGRLVSLDRWSLVLAALAIPVSILIVTFRWRIVLASLGERIAMTAALANVMIGLFFNQVLPSNLGGDAMRIWRLCKGGVGIGRSVGSVMLDRVIGVIALALLVLSTLPLAARLIEDAALLAAFGIFIVAVLAALALLLWLDRVVLLAGRILPGRLVDALSVLARDARAVLLNRRCAGAVLGLALCNQLLIVALIAVLARGLDIRVEPVAFLVLIPPVLLATMLPLSFAGWGVREGAMVVLLGAVGVAPGEALALSVAFGLLLLAGSLPGGVIWLVTGNRAVPRPRAFPRR